MQDGDAKRNRRQHGNQQNDGNQWNQPILTIADNRPSLLSSVLETKASPLPLHPNKQEYRDEHQMGLIAEFVQNPIKPVSIEVFLK